jgi:hypothetical protein
MLTIVIFHQLLKSEIARASEHLHACILVFLRNRQSRNGQSKERCKVEMLVCVVPCAKNEARSTLPGRLRAPELPTKTPSRAFEGTALRRSSRICAQAYECDAIASFHDHTTCCQA